MKLVQIDKLRKRAILRGVLNSYELKGIKKIEGTNAQIQKWCWRNSKMILENSKMILENAHAKLLQNDEHN